jgi:hypothetical protein
MLMVDVNCLACKEGIVQEGASEAVRSSVHLGMQHCMEGQPCWRQVVKSLAIFWLLGVQHHCDVRRVACVGMCRAFGVFSGLWVCAISARASVLALSAKVTLGPCFVFWVCCMSECIMPHAVLQLVQVRTMCIVELFF